MLDPSTCIAKLRQFAELLAKQVAIHSGTWKPDESQHDRLDRLKRETILNEEVARVFQTLRQQGNRATHDLAGDASQALFLLRLAWQLGWWFHHLRAPETITADLQPEFVEPTARMASSDVQVLKREEEKAGQIAETQIQHTPEQLIPKPAALKAAQKAAQLLILSEPETRVLIDQALRDAG